MLQLSSAPVRPSLLLPSLAAIVAIAIFVVDTVTPLDIAIAVLYVAVVLLAMDFAGRNGILIVAGGCAALTVLSYAITHGHDPASGPFLRCLISLVAIAITGALAARHQGTIEALRAHASLLDLTHDTIFVRNHDDVITYWNRAATELYGWRPEQAIGRKAAELLQTEFPAPFDDVMSELEAHRTLGRRIGAYRPRRPASRRGQPLGPAARRPRPSRRHPRDQQRHHRAPPGRGRPARAPRASSPMSRASPRWASSPPRSPTRSTSRWPPSSPTARPACAGSGRAVPDIGQARSSVEHMIRNGQRASEVVRRLRALSRKSDPSYAPVSLVDVVNDVALLIGRELQSHRATLSVNATDDLPLVQGDRVQLQQVVMNLLMNGMQAMDGVGEGPRRLAVEVGRSAEEPAVRRPDGERRRPRHRSRQSRPPVRRLLHHPPGRNGHGPVDQPLDRRGPWRPDLGHQPAGRRRPFPCQPADRTGAHRMSRSTTHGPAGAAAHRLRDRRRRGHARRAWAISSARSATR